MKQTIQLPDVIAGSTQQAEVITDKKGFGERWGFSPRHVSNLLAQGMPHLKIGKRRVRIVTSMADAWMIKRFNTVLPDRTEKQVEQ